MDASVIVALAGGLISIENKKPRKRRRLWAKNWLLQRNKFSHMTLLKELAEEEPQDFKNYLRMDEECFEDLLLQVTPKIEKKNTVMRESVSARERLVVTLQFLASGRNYENLKFSSAISPQLIGKIVLETCDAIFEVLKEKYLKFPTCELDSMNIASDFKKYWQVENCLGAIDGKHIAIKQPAKSGSYFYNYKGFHSIVLMAVVNANYEFIYVHCGSNGRTSDGGVLLQTDFGDLLEKGELNLPSPTSNPENRGVCLPFAFIADQAFPLKENLMKPYLNKGISHDERIFNYRICRGRRVVENAFGILASRFQVLQTSMRVNLDTVEKVVLACCVLHNYLRKKSPTYLTPSSVDWEDVSSEQLVEGEWRQHVRELLGLQSLRKGPQETLAEVFRGYYKDYYNNEGKVEFQERMINRR